MLPARNAGPPPHLARADAPAKNLVSRHEKLSMLAVSQLDLQPTLAFN